MSVFLESLVGTSNFGQFVNGVFRHHKDTRPLRFVYVLANLSNRLISF